MTDGLSDGRVEFAVDGATLTVRDAIKGEELPLRADVEPDLSPALPELFPFPVDRAVSFEAESLEIPEYASVVVRDADGDHVARPDEPMDLPRGSYSIEVNGATKATIRVTDVEISAGGVAGPGPVTLSFDRPRTVSVGGRSLHTRPEATITVPDDPTALTEAVSVLGSSIKEFTPERSWPTLRGYPPRIERGDSLEIPSPLTVPDTGVEVVVRPTYADVYRLSTLSYYLGARMTTGDAPAIRLETGYEERLPTEGRALEERVTELFKTWFFLDTLARTEGYTPSDRHSYEAVGSSLPFYPPNLADRTMSERVMEYLEVDHETVSPHLPAWPTEAVLRPVPASAELLPHLAHVLAPIRVRGDSDTGAPDVPVGIATSPQAMTTLSGSGGSDTDRGEWDGKTPVGVRSNPATSWDPTPDAEPTPAGVSVLSTEAYENRLRGQSSERGTADVAFLFDDPDRAQAVRESLSEPRELDGIESWTVNVFPSREAVIETMSDPELDIVYCGSSVAVDDVDPNGVDHLDERVVAPDLTVFEGVRDTDPGVDAIDRGGSCAILLSDGISPACIRTLIGLLTAGSPIAVAARLSLSPGSTEVRYVGDPATTITVDRGLATQLYSCQAQANDTYRVVCRSFLSNESLVGGEYRFTGGFSDSSSTLIGTEIEARETDVSGILQLHEEKSPILRFSDEIVLWSDNLSAEGVRELSRDL